MTVPVEETEEDEADDESSSGCGMSEVSDVTE